MTEVGNNLVENGHSPSDNTKMSRVGGSVVSGGSVNGQEHGFPTPPYNLVPSIREEEEDDEELDDEERLEHGGNFRENLSRRPAVEEHVDDDDEDAGMEVDPMNHQELDEDDEVDRPRIIEQLNDDQHSMDSENSYHQNGIVVPGVADDDEDEDKNGAGDDEDIDGHYGKTVRSILNHQKNLSRRISEDEQVTEDDDDDIEEDDEGKLIIDANELHQQQQHHHRLIESKLRNSAGAITTTTATTVNKSSGASSSRPSSTSPNRTSPNVHNAMLNSQFQQQQQASILNMMMTGNKDSRLVNGHGQQVVGSSQHQMMSSGRPFHEPTMERHHSSSHRNHHHHPSSRHHHNHHSHGRNDMIRSSDRKSSRSPLECDVKPEGLTGGLSNSNFNSSIGNALINLASLGSLASIPNLLTPGTASDSLTRSILSQQSTSTSSLQPPLPPPPFSTTMSGGSVNTPLNLTSNSGGGTSGGNNNSSYSSSNNTNNNSQNAFNNTLLTSHLAQLISQQQQQQQQNNNLLTNNLLNSAALAAAAASAAASTNTNNNNNSNSSIGNSNGSNNPSGMPQLILASGQIVQGIQGAQLLIPTSQGLMSQTILTIPLNSPGGVAGMGVGGQPTATSSSSPSSSSSSNLYPPSISPQIPNNNHHHHHHGSSSHHQSHLQQHQAAAAAAHAHGATRGHPLSPPVAPTVPPATSPDFSDHHPSALPAPNLNLGPHSLSSQMGAHIPMVQDKLSELHQLHQQQQRQQQRHHQSPASMNGGSRREMNTITTNGGLSISTLSQPKASPCDSSHDSDAFSDNDDSDQMVDGINLDEIKEFAKAFKLRRLSLGLTQTQVGQALSVTEGPAYSQSAICSALAWQLAQSQTHSNRTSIPQPFMFEKLDITPKSAQKIKPVLERWMKEAEDRYKNGHQNLNDFVGMEPSKKRKRRTSFTPQALEILNTHFERNTHPSGAEITTLAHQLGYEREVIRIWFCNKRQALKNTVRMMSK